AVATNHMIASTCPVTCSRLKGGWAVILCAATAALALGCSGDAMRPAEPAPSSVDDGAADGGATADGCVVARAGGGLVTVALPAATVLDTVTFTATPSEPNIDAVIGLAGEGATTLSDLATAVRFAPGGV